MLIDKVFDVLKQFSGKDYASGHFSPEEFSRYAEIAQSELLNEKYNGLGIDSYDEGHPLWISEFRSTVNISSSSTTSTYSVFNKPNDYRFFSSARSVDTSSGDVYLVDIDFIRDFEVGERLSSEIDKPTKTYPVIIEYGSFFGVAPKSVKNITLTYIKNPAVPVYAYTVSGGRPVFDEANSVDFTFGESMYPEIAFRMAKYLGIQIREPELVQYSQLKEQDRLT